jgi:hypothetical protein
MTEDTSGLARKLEDLCRDTKEAHLEAFRHTDGADPDWAAWYAAYLRAPMAALLGVEFSVEELARLLVEVEARRNAESPDAGWEPYYARFFLAR